MTESLPPVPDEAVAAILRWWYPSGSTARATQYAQDEARDELTAAWPVVGAAWLRWAADTLADPLALCDRYDISHSAGGANFVAACRAELRSLADEVEGQ